MTLALLTAASAGFFSGSEARGQVYPSGMVSYWTFDDGTAKDVLGRNPGTIVGAPSVVAGKVGGALQFDGFDDGIVVPNSQSLNPGQISMEVWVSYLSYKTSWFPRRNMIFDKRFEGVGTYDLAYNGYRDPGNPGGWEPYLFISGTWRWYIQGIPYQIPTRTWFHVVTTYDGANVRLYENGVLLKTWLQPGALTPTSTDLHLAMSGHHLDSNSNAVLDEVAIFNRALTLEEIQRHYANGVGGAGYADAEKLTIEVKPGSAANPINLRANGSIPVGVLSSPRFDATTVDVSTVAFAGAAPLPMPLTPVDLNGDGLMDVVLHFSIQDLQLALGDTEAQLTGATSSGQTFRGTDSVRVLK